MNEARRGSNLDEAADRYNEGRYDEAIGLWREVLAKDPSNQKAREGIRMASLLTGELAASSHRSKEQQAPSAQTDAEEILPRIEAGITRVRELASAGQFARALEGCALLEEIAPNLDQVRQLTEEIRRAAARPAGPAPGSGSVADPIEQQLEQARQALADGRNAEAGDAARRALRIDPSNMEACGILSLVGDDVEVAAPPEGGVDTGPIRSMDLGGAPIHQDGVPAAAPAAPSAPIADGRIEELLVSGQKSDDAGRPQEAIEIWSRIFALDQTNVEAGVRIDRVKAVIEEQSRQVDDLYYRAVDANEANRLEEALGLFQKVLAISPLHPEARSFIEEINLRLGGLGESICVDPGAAREAAEEKKRHIAADADERSVEGIASVPLAHVGPDSPYPPRVPAESSRPTTAAMAEPAAAGPRPGGGGRRLVMAAAGALVVAVVGVGAWLWMGGDTGSMPEARATVPVPASRPMRAGPSAKASPADADRQRGSAAPLRVVPGAAAPPEPEPKPRTVDPEELSKQSALLIREGRQFYQQKRWAEAVLAFRKALMADPVGFDAQDTLDKAMAELEKQARIERDMALAGKAFSEKDYAAALQKFYRIQQDHPEMKILDTYIRNSWFDWGVVLMQEGAPDEAAEKFSEVLDITSNDREASRARDFAKRYHGRQRDAVYDTFASALVMRSLDQP